MIKPLQFVVSTELSVLLQSSDGEIPINVFINRIVIQDHFGLSQSSKEQRREIVQANLQKIATIAADRYVRKAYATYQVGRTTFIQIVLDVDDLKGLDPQP